MTGLIAAGLGACLFKIWLFQQAPQWHDINPDSITFDFNARAFALHWQGLAADAHDFHLRGWAFLHPASGHGALWSASDALSYSGVVGSQEWLYPAYVGLWYWLAGVDPLSVIYSNAVFAAFFPAAAFGIAKALGASDRVALLAGALAVLDPSVGVNASWLLKDSLVGYLAMAALWALTRFVGDRSWSALVLSVPLFALLISGRAIAFLALAIAVLAVSLAFLRRRRRQPAAGLIMALAASWVLAGALYFVPHRADAVQWVMAPVGVVWGGADTLRAESGDEHADDTLLRWREALRTHPVLAVTKSIAHTLFAPYPWVALRPGLTWRSFSELYFPGMVLWIMCLPGIVWAFWRGIRGGKASFWFVAIFLGAVFVAYTVFQGEWSTRQRVFALPAFFALAAMGWSDIADRHRARRALKGMGK